MDRGEMAEAATRLAARYSISRPQMNFTHLNAAQRSNIAKYLIVVTQDDR